MEPFKINIKEFNEKLEQLFVLYKQLINLLNRKDNNYKKLTMCELLQISHKVDRCEKKIDLLLSFTPRWLRKRCKFNYNRLYSLYHSSNKLVAMRFSRLSSEILFRCINK